MPHPVTVVDRRSAVGRARQTKSVQKWMDGIIATDGRTVGCAPEAEEDGDAAAVPAASLPPSSSILLFTQTEF